MMNNSSPYTNKCIGGYYCQYLVCANNPSNFRNDQKLKKDWQEMADEIKKDIDKNIDSACDSKDSSG